MNKNYSILIFYLGLVLLLSSCFLVKSDKKGKTSSNQTENRVIGLYEDTTNYFMLNTSTDSVDIALLALIRDTKNISKTVLLEKARILVENGANPNNNIEEKWRRKKNVAKIPIIKDYVKNDYRTGSDYTTAFLEAVFSKRIDIVSLFYEYGFTADIPTKEKVYPINVALKNKDKKMINFLLEKKISLRNANLSFVQNTDLIIKLVEAGANPNSIDITYALGNIESLKKIIASEINISTVKMDFRSLLNNKKAFNFLLDNGLDPNIIGIYPYEDCSLLFAVIERGTFDDVKKIIAKGGNYRVYGPSYTNYTALIASVYAKNTILIDYFIDLGLNVNAKGDYSPLFAAVRMNDKTMINYLIKKGADVNAIYDEKRGRTIVLEAVNGWSLISVRTLIEHGVDINVADKEGETCLLLATDSKNYDLAKLLIESGADVNVANNDGQTSLLNAIYDDNLVMVKLLLDNGADKTIKYDENTLVYWATKWKANREIIELLNL